MAGSDVEIKIAVDDQFTAAFQRLDDTVNRSIENASQTLNKMLDVSSNFASQSKRGFDTVSQAITGLSDKMSEATKQAEGLYGNLNKIFGTGAAFGPGAGLAVGAAVVGAELTKLGIGYYIGAKDEQFRQGTKAPNIWGAIEDSKYYWERKQEQDRLDAENRKRTEQEFGKKQLDTLRQRMFPKSELEQIIADDNAARAKLGIASSGPDFQGSVQDLLDQRLRDREAERAQQEAEHFRATAREMGLSDAKKKSTMQAGLFAQFALGNLDTTEYANAASSLIEKAAQAAVEPRQTINPAFASSPTGANLLESTTAIRGPGSTSYALQGVSQESTNKRILTELQKANRDPRVKLVKRSK